MPQKEESEERKMIHQEETEKMKYITLEELAKEIQMTEGGDFPFRGFLERRDER